MDVFFGLFLAAFLSATLLPGTSEILLVSLLAEGYEPLTLWYWATAGNTLGSTVNWGLGRYLLHYQHKRWFPFKQKSLEKSQRWFQSYGVWAMLLAWAPVIGDALTFIAGVMRVRFIYFLILVAIGKGLRYGLILGLMDLLSS
ncbi:MAG: DedA family protein [Gammaproteobacteria bacterium]|jgi:membrane protein YqaA with SNARE-associated domain|nr:DedA family protein [Gammaproteobacteria bacterium]MBT3725519.1 DedA family protein [Gammaproteobacteria bacterium]MBT4194678.1 DedA family protein [Gammaproteobacteria bacterium]MBT4452323.1 DedA family protein [Gammaproteobacteria bacterium]MBT4862847.1 DedA family protein [Gammaproteobacteria bacterium]